MQPHGSRQRELSANALIELLWKVVKTKSFPSNSLSFFNQLGEKKYAVFAIQGPTHNFEIPETFEKDGVTEKVMWFYMHAIQLLLHLRVSNS